MLKKIPFYPYIFSIYPVLALYAINRQEVELIAIVRSLLFALLFGVIVTVFFRLVFKRSGIGAPLASLAILLFLSFGHIQKSVLQIPAAGPIAGRSVFLFPLLLAILVGIMFILKRQHSRLPAIHQALNAIAILLVIAPVVQTAFSAMARKSGQSDKTATFLQVDTPALASSPDVYYIILDTYGRQDILQGDFGIDNSSFIDGLRERGFYVADCSLSNYRFTPGSVGSSLYMDYVYNFIPEPEKSRNIDLLKNSLSNNRVRAAMESAGYRTVAFDTSYRWVNWRGTDIYYDNPEAYLSDPFFYPFETLFLDTTALRVLQKHNLLVAKDLNATAGIDYVQSHVKKTYAALDNLKETVKLNGPVFVYAHLMVPHPPFVFNPDGTASWENYFDEHTGEMAEDVDEYEGYKNNILFISNQIIQVVDTLLESSKTPPIIIIQGDHSSTMSNPFPILNAYYFPDGDYANLYPSISPVNSFRVVFNQYFGAELPLMEDISIKVDVNLPYSRQTIDAQYGKCRSTY